MTSSSSSFPSSRRITFQQTKHIQFGHIVEQIISASFGFRYPNIPVRRALLPCILDVTLKQLFRAHRLWFRYAFPAHSGRSHTGWCARSNLNGQVMFLRYTINCAMLVCLTVLFIIAWCFFFMNVIYLLLLLLFLAVPQCSCKNGNLYKQCLCCYFVLTTSDYHYVLYT